MLITYKTLSLNKKSTYYYILCYFPIQFCVSLCISCTGKRSGISVKGLRKFLSSEGLCCLWPVLGENNSTTFLPDVHAIFENRRDNVVAFMGKRV